MNNKFFYRLFFGLFLLSMFIIKLPPFYISFSTTKLLTTHVVAKFLIIIIFLWFVYIGRLSSLKNKTCLVVLLLYFISQSASILATIDIPLFLKDYQSLIFLLLIYLDAYMFAQNQKKIFIFFIIAGICMVFLDAVFFIFNYQFIQFVSPYIQKEMLPVYTVNLARERFNLYLNTELFLSFFISSLIFVKNKKSAFLYGSLSVSLIFLSVASNFRHRLLFVGFVILSYASILFYRKIVASRKIVFITFAVIIVGVSVSFVSVKSFLSTDITDRLLLDDASDVGSIQTRIGNFQRSLTLFYSSPIVGVGLGQYQLYLENKSATYGITNAPRKEFVTETMSDPHSIVSQTLGETGVIGLFFWALLVGYFMQKDLRALKSEHLFDMFPYMISFWGLFILSLITPSLSVFRGGWMWFLRGILEGLYDRSPKAGAG